MNTVIPSLYRVFLGGLFAVALAIVGIGCGGGDDSSSSGGSDDAETSSGLTLKVSSTIPGAASASLSSRLVSSGLDEKIIPYRPKLLEQGVPETGSTVSVADHNGEEIAVGETLADGTCELAGDISPEDLAAGIEITVEDLSTGIQVVSIVQLDADEVTEIEDDITTLGTATVEEDVNTESTVAAGIIKDECDGDVATCGANLDIKCMSDLVKNSLADEAGASTVGGEMAALLQLQATMMVAAPDQPPAQIMAEALAGDDPTLITAHTEGVEEIEGVPAATALTRMKEMVETFKDSYCALEGGVSPWKEIKDAAQEAGEEFDPGPLAQIMNGYPRDQFTELRKDPAQFAIYGRGLVENPGGFQAFRHPEVLSAMREQMKLGLFQGSDQTSGSAGMAFLMAGLEKPTTGQWGDWRAPATFSSTQLAQATYNTFSQVLTQAGGTFTGDTFRPDKIAQDWRGFLSSSKNQQLCATGGTRAGLDNMVAGFVNQQAGTGFDYRNFQAEVKSPPGASCTSNSNCLPCDTCTNNVCVSLSTKMGVSCSSNSDCDAVTDCRGGYFSGAGGNCMCAAGIPDGSFIHDGAGGGEPGLVDFGGHGDFVAVVAGQEGGQCGITVKTSCQTGLSCTGTDYGICLKSTFLKAPFSACGASSECESKTCTGGVCAILTATQITSGYTQTTTSGSSTTSGTTTTVSGSAGTVATTAPVVGTRKTGDPCEYGSQCSTFFCSAGLCAAAPTTFGAATTSTTALADGKSCTYGYECQSHYCDFTSGSSGTCKAAPTTATATTTGTTTPITTTTGGATPGSYCTTNAMCASQRCDDHMHQCLIPL